VIGTVEKHGVFSIIRVLSIEPMPYQLSTPPGEKCGLDSGDCHAAVAARNDEQVRQQ